VVFGVFFLVFWMRAGKAGAPLFQCGVVSCVFTACVGSVVLLCFWFGWCGGVLLAF